VETEFPSVLKDWIRKEAKYVVPTIDYLFHHPGTFWALATLADMEAELGGVFAGLDMYSPTGRHEQRWFDEQVAARDLLSTGKLAICPSCFLPMLFFADGQRIAWPDLGTHECKGGE